MRSSCGIGISRHFPDSGSGVPVRGSVVPWRSVVRRDSEVPRCQGSGVQKKAQASRPEVLRGLRQTDRRPNVGTLGVLNRSTQHDGGSVMRRPRWSESNTAEVWQRWEAGESLRTIATAFACTHPAIGKVLRRTGGRRPPLRRRAARVLTSGEREEISRGVASGEAFAAIGRRLARPRSTISREVGRHGGRPVYRAAEADRRAWANAGRRSAVGWPCGLGYARWSRRS